MPEPATIVAIGFILKALELVHKRREGSLSKQEARDLYCNIFSSLLFEVHQNLDRCRMFLEDHYQKGSTAGGILSFFVRDALFSDFCIMCPEPLQVSDLNGIYSGFERMHYWQRVTTDLSSQTALLIIGFAGAMFRRELHLKYNTLLGILKELCPNTAAPPEFDPSTIPSEALEP